MITDPISDLIVRLKNASAIGKEDIVLPYSVMKHSIATVLQKEGYVAEVSKKNNSLVIGLVYKAGRPAIGGAKRISKPSRRMYMSVRDIHPVKRGYGLLVLSTPAGILSGKEAKEKRAGGEALFEIW